jgi:hypothetical protein
MPEQSVKSDGQRHLLLMQSFPLVHLLPQTPQLFGSLLTSTQELEQAICPLGQL